VAKATAQRLTERTVFTEVGQMVGTLEYMAPEQAELNNLDIDTRADVYSLGVILYELLAGSPPFTAKQLRGAAFTEMLRILRDVEPPRPSTKLSTSEELPSIAARRKLEPKKLAKLVHGDLDWIAMKCLEKDRGRRYQTANGLARDLERYLHDEPVEAGPPGAAYRLRKLARKYRAPLRVAGVFLVLLVLAAAVSVWQAVRATLAERAAVRERDRAEQNFRLARDAVDRYFTKVSDSPPLRAAGLEKLRRDLLLQAKEFYERFVDRQPGEPALQAELGNGHARLGDILQALGDTAAAEGHYARAVEIFEDLARREPGEAGHRRRLAQCQRDLGRLFLGTSRPGQAQPLLEQAVATAERLGGEHADDAEYQHDRVLAWDALGGLWRHTNRPGRAEEAYRRAVAVAEELVREHADPGGKHRSVLAASAGHLAEVYRLAGRHDDAEAYSRRAVDEYERLARAFPREGGYQHLLARAYHVQSSTHLDAGHADRAEEPLRRAADIGERLVREHPDVLDHAVLLASSYNRLARFENGRGNLQAVRAWCDKGIQTLQKVLEKEPRHSGALRDLNDLRVGRAVALARTGEYARAAEDAEEMARQEGLTPVDVFNVACVYARCLEAAGKDAKLSAAERARRAEQYGRRATESLREALARGFQAVPVLRTDPDLQPLQRREDFRQLLREAEGKK
jgi:tetratricopeptide (TPR) repeat protein